MLSVWFLVSFSVSGHYSLSFQKGNHLDMQNWRPISLLNVDYKQTARTIAARLLKVIHLVIAEDQTCGVPGRYIGENVAFLCGIVLFAGTFDSPVVILSLDQEKAFDRVDWGYMYATLCKMGFGTSFLKWVNLFYTDVQRAVNVNGYFYISSPCLVVFVKAVLCLRRCMFLCLRYWLETFMPIPISKVSCWLV